MTESDDRGPDPRWPDALSTLGTELDSLFRGNPYLRRMAVEVDDWGLGWARTRLVPLGDLANIMGTAHGGVVVGVADTAFEIACNSYGRQCVAVELTTHFLRPAEMGKSLVAESREISRSARLASYEVQVTEGGSGSRSIATLLALAYRTDGWHLGADRYPDDWKARY